MSAPSRTTFEVTIINKLEAQSIWVKIAAELNYATNISSSATNSSKVNRESDTSTKSKTFKDESHKTSVGVDIEKSGSVNIGGQGASSKIALKTNVSHEQTNITSSENEEKNIQNEMDENASSNKLSVALTNKTIEPGFVKIGPLQSLSIPVIVENESQVAYITVYYFNMGGYEIFLANGLQINRQIIEIGRNDNTKEIEISPKSRTSGKYNDFRNHLLKWGLPEYLCDAMKQCGWDDTNLWEDITNTDLMIMGFKRGHRIKFNKSYINFKMMSDRIDKKLSYKDLLQVHDSIMQVWTIPIHLYRNMKENGWDDVYLWYKLIDENAQQNKYEELKNMGFKMGHIEKFKLNVNEKNDHIKQFKKMQKNLQLHQTNTVINNEYDDDDDNNEQEYKSQYDPPQKPSF
eukprot:538474_1